MLFKEINWLVSERPVFFERSKFSPFLNLFCSVARQIKECMNLVTGMPSGFLKHAMIFLLFRESGNLQKHNSLMKCLITAQRLFLFSLISIPKYNWKSTIFTINNGGKTDAVARFLRTCGIDPSNFSFEFHYHMWPF